MIIKREGVIFVSFEIRIFTCEHMKEQFIMSLSPVARKAKSFKMTIFKYGFDELEILYIVINTNTLMSYSIVRYFGVQTTTI